MKMCSVWQNQKAGFYLPGKGPSPGGIKSVPRILPSLTGILFTPSAMICTTSETYCLTKAAAKIRFVRGYMVIKTVQDDVVRFGNI